MFRRLAPATIIIVALLLVPSLARHTRAASTPLCAATTAVSRVITLPIQPMRSRRISGVFCFTTHYAASAGKYMLPYEARITGLDADAPVALRVAATVQAADRGTLNVQVYQPSFTIIGVIACGCIGFAHPNPPPHSLLRGVSISRFAPAASDASVRIASGVVTLRSQTLRSGS